MSRQLREKEQETDGLHQKMEALRQEQRKLEKSRREVGRFAGRWSAFIKLSVESFQGKYSQIFII